MIKYVYGMFNIIWFAIWTYILFHLRDWMSNDWGSIDIGTTSWLHVMTIAVGLGMQGFLLTLLANKASE